MEKTKTTYFEGGEEYKLTYKGKYVPVITFYEDPSKNQTFSEAFIRLLEITK